MADRHDTHHADLRAQLVARDGQIHMLFSRELSDGGMAPAQTDNFIFAANEAFVMATLLADLAFEADTALKPAGDVVKAELVERHRTKLVDRLTVVMNTQREKKTTTNRKLARQLVDICLSEVFSS